MSVCTLILRIILQSERKNIIGSSQTYFSKEIFYCSTLLFAMDLNAEQPGRIIALHRDAKMDQR